MPRHRPLHRYPREYFECYERAQEGPYKLELDSPERARYIRADLYNLRAAVRAQIVLDPHNDELTLQFLLMENIVIRLDNNVLHFSSRSYKNEEHIRKALSNPSKDITDVFK